MTITLDPNIEARLRKQAEAEGLTISAYVEQLLTRRERAREQIEAWALEGRNSGAPIEVGPGYWEEKQRRLLEQVERDYGRAELERLALEGINSGPAIEVGAEFWNDIHRQIDERFGRSGRE